MKNMYTSPELEIVKFAVMQAIAADDDQFLPKESDIEMNESNPED